MIFSPQSRQSKAKTGYKSELVTKQTITNSKQHYTNYKIGFKSKVFGFKGKPR